MNWGSACYSGLATAEATPAPGPATLGNPLVLQIELVGRGRTVLMAVEC